MTRKNIFPLIPIRQAQGERTGKRKNNSPGFSLIEIIVALLITSIITLSLYNIYSRIQRSVFAIQELVDLDMPIPSFYNQLEKDIMGIFIPYSMQPKPIPVFPQKQEGDKKEKEKNKNVFLATKKEDLFLLTFLTTGGFKAVDSKGAALASPYIYRVVYTVESDKSNPGYYVLKRSQIEDTGNNLDFDINQDKHKGPAYAIGGRFKKFNVSLQLFKKSKDGKIEGTEKISDFNPEEIFKKYQTYIPAFVEISGIFAIPNVKKEIPFSYKFLVPAYNFSGEESKRPEEQAKGNKPETAPKELGEPEQKSVIPQEQP